MGKLLKGLVILVVVVLAISYVVYSLDYKGNYNLSVSVEVASDYNSGDATVSSVDWDSDATSLVDWWDVLKGHSTSEGQYALFFSLNESEAVSFTQMSIFDLMPGNSTTVEVAFENIAPGTYTLSVELYYRYTATTLYIHEYAVKVGV